LKRALAEREREGLFRRIETPLAGRVDFVTNDYLGFSRRPELAAAVGVAAAEAGAGARAARMLGGDTRFHREAEARCAEWLGCEAAVLLPTGSQSNFAVLGALLADGDCVFSDRENHASLVDGIRLTRAKRYIYSSATELEGQLRLARAARRRIIVSDAVFSVDGREAALLDLMDLADRYGAGVVVDEAHSAGVLGPAGRGLCAREGVADRVLARVVTGGKALGVAGGFVAGSRVLADAIVNFSRAFLFTTAPPAPVAAALSRAIELAAAGDAERQRVVALRAFFVKALRDAGLAVADRAVPIVFVEIGDAGRAAAAARDLCSEGFEVRAIRPPTVARGRSGLRLVVHADHDEALLARAARAVARVCRVATDTTIPPTTRPILQHAVAIIGTGTGVGKTLVSSALLARASRRRPVAYWKPVQTGTGDDDDTATVAKRFHGEGDRIVLFSPVFAFPEPIAPAHAAARHGIEIRTDPILDRLASIAVEAAGRPVLVEWAGGLLVPFSGGDSQENAIVKMKIPVVLVAQPGLGTIHHVRSTLEACAARGIVVDALVLSGPPDAENRATLGGFFEPERIYSLPPVSRMTTEGLAEAARAAGLDSIVDRWLDRTTGSRGS
jgi:8-amino-7-oxononanoate synthase